MRPVDGETREACTSLCVAPGQEGLIAPNARSLEWAAAHPRCVPLVVLAADQVVGFAMYEPRGRDVYSIHRFMIDGAHQRRGIGRRAMQLLIEHLGKPGGVTIYLSFRPENGAAHALYTSLGFVEHEVEPDGEIIYRLGPVRDVVS